MKFSLNVEQGNWEYKTSSWEDFALLTFELGRGRHSAPDLARENPSLICFLTLTVKTIDHLNLKL